MLSGFPSEVYHRCSSGCLSHILNAMFIDDNCFLSSDSPVCHHRDRFLRSLVFLSLCLSITSFFVFRVLDYVSLAFLFLSSNKPHTHRQTDTHLKKALIEDVCWRARGKEWVRARTENISVVFSLDLSSIVLEMMPHRSVDQWYTLLVCKAKEERRAFSHAHTLRLHFFSLSLSFFIWRSNCRQSEPSELINQTNAR